MDKKSSIASLFKLYIPLLLLCVGLAMYVHALIATLVFMIAHVMVVNLYTNAVISPVHNRW